MPKVLPKSAFAKELAKLRIDNDEDIGAMAAKLEVNGSTLRAYEQGARAAPITLFNKIKEVYGVNISHLWQPAEAKRLVMSELPPKVAEFVQAALEGLIEIPDGFTAASLREGGFTVEIEAQITAKRLDAKAVTATVVPPVAKKSDIIDGVGFVDENEDLELGDLDEVDFVEE